MFEAVQLNSESLPYILKWLPAGADRELVRDISEHIDHRLFSYYVILWYVDDRPRVTVVRNPFEMLGKVNIRTLEEIKRSLHAL